MAIQRDAEASRPFGLGEFWEGLARGAWVFRDTFETEQRYLAIVQAEAMPFPINPRKLRLLESVLLGTPPKVVAFDNQRALSSITASIQDCVRGMGLVGRVSQASVLLTIAARAHGCSQPGIQVGRISDLELEGQAYLVISAPRPDIRFPVPLSLAEAAVLRGLLTGNSHAQISDARATSPRTVANQLATAFRKLGVSGRRATLERLIQHSAGLE
jgi:DNA-binding CsgD family transcriptional regulator